MKERILHPVLQKLAALIVLGVALGVTFTLIAYPLVEALATRDAAQARLARYQAVLTKSPNSAVRYDPADLAANRVDEPAAQLALQTSVAGLARNAGIAVQSTRPIAAEHLGGIDRGAWLELTFVSDLRGFVDFLNSLDTQRPLLLVRRLEVQRGDGPRPDLFLRTTIHIGQAWRPAGGAT